MRLEGKETGPRSVSSYRVLGDSKTEAVKFLCFWLSRNFWDYPM